MIRPSCGGRDSNSHRITPTTPSKQRVYHFTTTALFVLGLQRYAKFYYLQIFLQYFFTFLMFFCKKAHFFGISPLIHPYHITQTQYRIEENLLRMRYEYNRSLSGSSKKYHNKVIIIQQQINIDTKGNYSSTTGTSYEHYNSDSSRSPLSEFIISTNMLLLSGFSTIL